MVHPISNGPSLPVAGTRSNFNDVLENEKPEGLDDKLNKALEGQGEFQISIYALKSEKKPSSNLKSEKRYFIQAQDEKGQVKYFTYSLPSGRLEQGVPAKTGEAISEFIRQQNEARMTPQEKKAAKKERKDAEKEQRSDEKGLINKIGNRAANWISGVNRQPKPDISDIELVTPEPYKLEK